jgi:4-hydroxybenzoate polyprenyltransferase
LLGRRLLPGRDPIRADETASRAGAVRTWLRQVRVPDWAHFLPVPLATFDPHGGPGALLAAARGVVIAFAILAFGYLLNSVSDRRMDLDVRKNPFIVAGTSRHRYSLVALVSLTVLLAAFSPWPAQLAALSCLTIGWIYSTGPRIKSIPIVGSLANLGNFGPLLFVGMQHPSLPPRFGWVALVFSAILLQNQLIHEAGDAIEDRGGGVHTTWLTLGSGWTTAGAALLGLIAAVGAARTVSPARSTLVAVGVGAAFGVVFPLLLAWRGRHPQQAARLRLIHRWCALPFGAALFAAWRWAL